jgi:cation transport regulator ChaC
MIDILETAPLFVMKLDVGYARAVHLGSGAFKGRSVFPVEGGIVAGDRVNGSVDGGADWVTWRDDGAMLIDVRITLRTDDGASIGMIYEGIAHADNDTMDRFRTREALGADEVYTRTAVRFETSHRDYLWLNSIIAVAKGMRTDAGPMYHVFEIR